MDKQIFNMKFTSKQLQRMSSKAQKDHEKELLKVKKAMEKGDPESARIYAENAIRIKNTGNGYLRMSSRIDGVASRLESAIKMQQVSKQMGQVTKGMEKILASMDINQISAVMDKFESSFDEVDMRAQCRAAPEKRPPPAASSNRPLPPSASGAAPHDHETRQSVGIRTRRYVENAMGGATASSMPEDQVESLLQQVSDAHGLQFASSAASASTAPMQTAVPTAISDTQEDALEKRLAALRTA